MDQNQIQKDFRLDFADKVSTVYEAHPHVTETTKQLLWTIACIMAHSQSLGEEEAQNLLAHLKEVEHQLQVQTCFPSQ